MFCGFKICFQNYFGAIRKKIIARNVKKYFSCVMISDDPINSCVPHLMSLEYFFFSSDYFTLNHGKTLENGANVKNSTLFITCY